MAFYKIIANNTVSSDSSQTDVKSNHTLIGHINSEQIGNKYVYVIHFDRNIDSNQQLTDCSLQSTDETSFETSFRHNKFENDINLNVFNVQNIEPFAQILNNSNNISDEQLNDSKFEDINSNCDSKQQYEEKDNNQINQTLTYNKKNNAKKVKSKPVMQSQDKNFVCEWPHCHKRFNRKGILITHMRIHTGERPYVCDWPQCEKRFNQICVLKNHKRTHTGERPYICDYSNCGQSFKTSGSLHHHRMNHEGKQHQNIKKYNKLNAKCAKFAANTKRIQNKANNNKTNKTVETLKNYSIEKIYKNDENPVRSDAGNQCESEKFPNDSKVCENEEKNSYECTFENCHQKFARKCALINHFNYRHQSDCY